MIELRNVTKKYGDFYAIKDINFKIDKGEIVGFLGRNGAGKTTTMNVITGYIKPTSGEIILGEEDDKQNINKEIGYMPEGTPLYSDLTAKEFITYMAELRLVPKKQIKDAVEKAIKETGLEKVQNNLAKNLSRGYKQRLSLAGAIVGDPKILILDEPTVGLDPKQVVEIRELIKSFRKNHTVILSSHILSEISQICEKVIIIDKGEIIAVDTPSNLEKKVNETEKLYITIASSEMNFETIKEDISQIKNIKLFEEKENEKVYEIEYENNDSASDIRQVLFTECAKKEIVILEMKKEEVSLESAFIKLIENRPEYSQKEVRKMNYEKEMDELRKEDNLRKEEKLRKKEERKKKKENSNEGGDK